ncbi:hypothetical protein DERF_010417 [Dermatophagoides farinae]|uniref:Uncharacterized protein n=1 Tax=Dermatophagoides farinae TaxID=6954 RepID=A0A922L3I5_DERFA|nr:hypothetical protein DERF_010417 [Dermatophagoides farinae]
MIIPMKSNDSQCAIIRRYESTQLAMILVFCILLSISTTDAETVQKKKIERAESLIPNPNRITNNDNNLKQNLSISPTPLKSIHDNIVISVADDDDDDDNNVGKHDHHLDNHSRSLLSSETIVENILSDGSELIDTSTNTTAEAIVKATPILKLIHDYLLVILLISVMFSMGCGVTIIEVWNHLRRPTAVLVCIAAQFFLVPFIGYLIMTLLELEVLHSTGLLILACCPGGVTSNIFTFIADGDLPLSITMTSVATIAALLLMPLNVWLYGRNLETNNLVIPYMEMSITLILVTIPVILGMILNWRLPKYTPYITKIGVFAGFGIICFCQSLEVIIFPDIFFGVPYRLYTAVILLPAFSFMAGYVFARVFRLNNKICRTIGIEIGIKNVGSALTIISLSFTLQQLKKAWVFPFLYAFSSFMVIFAVTIGYKMAKRLATNQLHKGFHTVDTIEKCSIKDENANRIINVDEMNIAKERLLLNEQNVRQFQLMSNN